MTSKRRLRRRQCQRKIRHETEADALVALREVQHKRYRPNVRAYKCHYCGGWHIGRMPGQMVRAMDARRNNS